MRLEERTNLAMYALALFVAGWVSCQSYYKLPSLWNKVNEAQTSCEHSRRQAIIALLAEQDDGRPVNWAEIKSCPKTSHN